MVDTTGDKRGNNTSSLNIHCWSREKTVCWILSDNEFYNLTQTMDRVGWYNFMEGKIPKEIIRLQEDYYRKSQFLKTVTFWGPQLVLKLLGIVRSQWLYRCEVVNKRDKDGQLK